MAKTLMEKIKVMEAALNGEHIQVRAKGSTHEWHPCHYEPDWDWAKAEYRVKTEPEVIYLFDNTGWKVDHKYVRGWAYSTPTPPITGGKMRKFIEVIE